MKKKDDNSLVLLFKNVKAVTSIVLLTYDKLYSEYLSLIVNLASKEIFIDKTYVDLPNSKYLKTFISDEGWKALCKLEKKTRFGLTASKKEKVILQESYKALILQYLYLLLNDLGHDVKNIKLDVCSNSSFNVEFYQSTINDIYPGKWQTWKCNL